MNMKKSTYIVLIAAAALSVSCKDFLKEEPFLTQSNALALADYDGLNKAVAGAYGPLADGAWYGADYVLTSQDKSDIAALVAAMFTNGDNASW